MTELLLNDTDRRTLGNLGQPRSVTHLTQELTQDPYTLTERGDQVHEGQEVLRRLKGLEAQGLVVNLGEFLNPGKAAAAAVRSKTAFDFEDESGQIFERRLKSDRHKWRTFGDLWIASKDGIDYLKAPIPNEPPPLSLAAVQALINNEYENRVLKGVVRDHFKPGDTAPSLSHKLLEDEFLEWVKQVSDVCEQLHGERPVAPLGGGAGYSDTYELNLLDAENQKTALGAVVDPWFMALTILAFTDTDTGTTADNGSHIPTYTGYARKSVAGTDMNAASAGSANNLNAIIFAACTAGSSAILGFGNCSTSTVGLLRKYGTCTSTAVSTTQTPPQFASTAYTTSVD